MAESFSMLQQDVMLSNKETIPLVHLNTYGLPRRERQIAIDWALRLGYCGLACANDGTVEAGRALAAFLNGPGKGSLSREDVFFTDRLEVFHLSYEDTQQKIQARVKDSLLGYIDLFLLANSRKSVQARLGDWRAVMDAIDEGSIRMAGVADYDFVAIEELMASEPRIKPVVNQIEVNPFNTQTKTRILCEKYGIVVQARSPLAGWRHMWQPLIRSLSAEYHCRPAQILIKWGLQHNMLTMPQCFRRKDLIQIADVARLHIRDEHMKLLDKCNKGERHSDGMAKVFRVSNQFPC